MRVENARHHTLLKVFRCPAKMADLTDVEWDALLPRARACNCLARLAAHARTQDLVQDLPGRVRTHLEAAAIGAAHQERTIRWELNRIERALAALTVPIILLKGAAYVAAEFPFAKARLASDVDIMVRGAALQDVEQALLQSGWQQVKPKPYDQRYYRTWMHELPPLHHLERGTVVDVHHSILPTTARLKPDTDQLWAQARWLGRGRLHVLAPTDMVLHSATHLFYDGDLEGSLGNLLDIHDLLAHFGSDGSFWRALVPRAATLELGRPLFYALRYCQKLLRIDVPKEVTSAVAAFAPSAPVLRAMDRLVPRALIPGAGEGASAFSPGRTLLYMRSHWLRMPPWLLASHLTHQALRRFSSKD